jgi:hypothetical protein
MGGVLMTQLPEKTTFPKDALGLTKLDFPKAVEAAPGLNLWTSMIAQAGDRITPWGDAYDVRDQQLREFWPTEPYLAGAVTSTCIRNAAFEWEIQVKGEGTSGSRLEMALTDMLNGAITGEDFGWIPFMSTGSQDYYTQDNGWFIELIRDPGIDAASRFKNENAPVIGLAHLDSGKCQRTGNPQIPVIYWDRQSKPHKMKWWQIIARSEFPSAIQTMNNVGYSAVTRVLRMAQIMSSIEIYKDEKISGRQYRAIHFVSGIAKTEIDDVLADEAAKADNEGLIRFLAPAIITSLDPERPVTTATIELASLPDGFDIDEEMKWYISAIALGFGGDYQDFAPLPTGNIGSSQQSEILHRKSRGKGAAHFMENVQNWFRDYGVMPRNAEFKFKLKDAAEELEEVEKHKEQAELLAIVRRANILDGKAAREALRRWGIFDDEILNMVPDDFGRGR